MPTAQDLYDATRMLFRAFQYLQPRMHGGSLSPSQEMNDEALAGCILHGCMSRVLRDIQTQRDHAPRPEWPSGWIERPPLAPPKAN
jgi:hypothetical protein